jgi:hypothetical protein
MKEHIISFLPELRAKLLERMGIAQMRPLDCSKLSNILYENTGYQISTTTLKRLFGFADSPYALSPFTLDVLSIYCGFKGWVDFITYAEAEKNQADVMFSWNEIRNAAHRVTRFTAARNKQKCGISYLHSIAREGIDQHMSSFFESGRTACLISAAAGAGKTIGMTHWIDQRLAAHHRHGTRDIYLFVHGSSLTFAVGSGFHCNKWLAQLLNFPNQELFQQFINLYEQVAPGKFHLIIDDFNNKLANDRQFEIAFGQLVDMVSYLSHYKWMKVIVTLRPYTWQKYGHIIENHVCISADWFTNINPHQQSVANTNMNFTLSELQELIYRVNKNLPIHPSTLNEHVHLINFPLNFQYYYSINGNTIPTSGPTLADAYLIAEEYVQQKVTRSGMATEKLAFFNTLVDSINFVGTQAFIDKKTVYLVIKDNYRILTELLETGILEECQQTRGTRAFYYIRFNSYIIATYFIAKRAFEQYDTENSGVLEELYIHKDWNKQVRISVLKWLVLFRLEAGNLNTLNDIKMLDISINQRISLLLLFSRRLEVLSRRNAETKDTISKWLGRSTFVDLLFDNLVVQQDYMEAMITLLKYPLHFRQRILLNTALAFCHFCYLEDEKVHHYLEKLQAIPPEYYSDFSLNPLRLLEELHFYYRNPHVPGGALEELSLFCRIPERNKHLEHKHLFLLLGYLILMNRNDQVFITSYADIVEKYLPKQQGGFELEPFAHLLKAYSYAHLGKSAEALHERNIAVSLCSSSPLNKLHLHMVDLRLSKARPERVHQLAQKLLRTYRRSGIKYGEAAIRIFLNYLFNDYNENLGNVEKLADLFKDSNYQISNMTSSIMRHAS